MQFTEHSSSEDEPTGSLMEYSTSDVLYSDSEVNNPVAEVEDENSKAELNNSEYDEEKLEKDTDLIKHFFEAGVTPDFADSLEEVEILEGRFLCLLC